MNLLIVGASGATGQHLVRLALAQGHMVTAFVRDAARMRIESPLLTVKVGDVMKQASVDQAIAGQEAVFCALGAMPDTKADRDRRQPGVPVCSTGTKHLLGAMEKFGCQRIIVESSSSIGSSRHTGVFGASMVVRTVLRDVMDDKEAQEAAVMASSADWTIVRPVKLTNGPDRGAVRSGENLKWSLLSSVSRADTAVFMMAKLSDTSSFRKAITIKS